MSNSPEPISFNLFDKVFVNVSTDGDFCLVLDFFGFTFSYNTTSQWQKYFNDKTYIVYGDTDITLQHNDTGKESYINLWYCTVFKRPFVQASLWE